VSTLKWSTRRLTRESKSLTFKMITNCLLFLSWNSQIQPGYLRRQWSVPSSNERHTEYSTSQSKKCLPRKSSQIWNMRSS
jgi:hypothetical protein